MNQNFNDDLIELFNLINAKNPFAFMRFADGESAIMRGISIQGIDGWTSTNYLGQLGKDLLIAIDNNHPDVYTGISCDCCDINNKNFLYNLIKNKKENITFSNIFVNSNYDNFIKLFTAIKEPINLISNYRAKLFNFPLKIKDFVSIPDNCVSLYETNKNIFLKNFDKFKQSTNELFIISAGPLSEVVIDYLWKTNPSNRYIDVGSAIGEWIHGQPIREFAHINSVYRKRMCYLTLENKSEKREN